jgi:hypothetical protein
LAASPELLKEMNIREWRSVRIPMKQGLYAFMEEERRCGSPVETGVGDLGQGAFTQMVGTI